MSGIERLKTAWVVTTILAASVGISVRAAYLRNVPQTLVQPDGSVVQCLASGDEFYHWAHDAGGFVIVRDEVTGVFVYAEKRDGKIVPTGHVVGRSDPAALGLEPDIRPAPEDLRARRERPYAGGLPLSQTRRPAPTKGTLNNVVIFVRFSDDGAFTDTVAAYNALFNGTGAADNSMKNYYSAASYNQITVSTTFYPTSSGTVASFQYSQPRNYFRKYNASSNPIGYQNDDESAAREWALLKAAVDAVGPQVPSGLNVDGDGDGLVDNVCFVIKGSPDNWADLLWPHMWFLLGQEAFINGKRVGTYNFNLETSLGESGNGVLCHEMFHSLGSPDLYHYNQDGKMPVGSWDLMEQNGNPPQHMGAYMKCRYGKWISDIPQITASGTYTLNPLQLATNNCFRINSPNSATEFFVVEYRWKDWSGGFDSGIPGSGLLVYRINTAADGVGNRGYPNPPDEVYLYRIGGNLGSEGYVDYAAFCYDFGQYAINDSTNPPSWLWNGGSGGAGGLQIQAGYLGSTLSFQVTNPAPAFCSLPCSAYAPETGNAGTALEFYGSASPMGCQAAPAYSWSFGDGQISTQQNPTHAYASGGTFAWALTVSADGRSCSKSGSITVTGTATRKAGDCDGNGTVSITELQQVVNNQLGITQTGCGDCDNSGSVSITELQKVVNCQLAMPNCDTACAH